MDEKRSLTQYSRLKITIAEILQTTCNRKLQQLYSEQKGTQSVELNYLLGYFWKCDPSYTSMV